MKTILIILCAALASALHAAEPPPSFVWQGKTIVVSQLEQVDATRAKLPDGTMIPLSAVPSHLLPGIAPIPPPGKLFTNLRVLQILADGLLMEPAPVEYVSRIKGEGVYRSTEILDPIFLRLPNPPDRVNGTQPDQTMSCYAEPDGQYIYTTQRGAVKTIEAWKWTGGPPVKPAPKPAALLPGSQIKGSALDARDWRTQRR